MKETNRDAFSLWEALMRYWKATETCYQAALETRELLAGEEDALATIQNADKAAREHLEIVQSGIDDLIRNAAKKRTAPQGTIAVAMVETLGNVHKELATGAATLFEQAKSTRRKSQ